MPRVTVLSVVNFGVGLRKVCEQRRIRENRISSQTRVWQHNPHKSEQIQELLPRPALMALSVSVLCKGPS